MRNVVVTRDVGISECWWERRPRTASVGRKRFKIGHVNLDYVPVLRLSLRWTRNFGQVAK